ncbi:ABC transporter B family member [Saliniradius amylolyticus]|uniref:ABC transporter B family member n=1 Tax=Saliniradius amylolyticus TaxID=2183582 RepID=A0A2S2E1S0_9ALTE|nr:ABC transporter ATP-binding protein/permease [Saliniradius amylolyticus]AWL11584.1 ABC transporter B family member [Saliniradius amylolyticus]
MRSNRFPVDNDHPVNWHTLKQLLPYLSEFKARIGLALVCLIGAKLASIGMPFVLKYIVDDLNMDSTEKALLAVPVALIVAYGSLRLFNTLAGEIRDTLFGRVTERAMRRVGLKVFKHLHRLDLSFHLDRQTGGLARDIERGTNGISFLLRFMVFNIVPTLLEITLVVGVLFYQFGFSFASVLLVAVVVYIWFSVKATHWRTEYVRQMNQADSGTNTRAIDSLLNYETVKYFNNEGYESRQYDKHLADWEQARRNNRLSLFALNGGQALVIAVAMTAMLLLAAQGVASGAMTIGDFVMVNAFTMQIFMPLNFLGFVYREIRGAMANIEQLFGLLKLETRINDQPGASELKVTQGRVEFKHVNFAYQPDRPILEELNFTIEPGQKVAVVGPSGAGKSTLVKLLFRFYDVTQGQISIDGQDIRSVSQDSLRKAIGIVPQDTVLFNDSLFENIRYARPDASDEEVNRVIDLAHLRHFVEALPKGAETKVGERGLKLSGGEKQRVAIARVLLKRPPVMVFDEATSSLDSRSEQAIVRALKEVARGHSSLVIAHRLSTIVDADKILVLEQGRIAESGSHSELLSRNGLYAALWRNQQQEQHDEPTTTA